MTVVGKVTHVAGKTAKVVTQRPASCERCASAALCKKNSRIELKVLNPIHAKEGDCVTVQTGNDRQNLLLLCYLFLTPVAILFLSAWLYTLTPAAALTGLPLLAGYGALLKYFDKHHNASAVILAPAEPPEECDKENFQN